MILQQGFVLSTIKYGENDAVLNMFTIENGFQSFFVKGVYAKKNKKKPFLVPFYELVVGYSQPKSQKMPLVSRIELAKAQNLQSQPKIHTILFFTSDFLNQMLRNEPANAYFYNEISRFLDHLASHNTQAHLSLLYSLLVLNGVQPLKKEGEFLDPESGEFGKAISHQLFDSTVSDWYRQMGNTEDYFSVKAPKGDSVKILDSLLVYYQYHIPDFRTPKTVEILQQILH